MGCGGSKDIKYQHGMKTRKIPVKHAATLEKWQLGANARLKVLKMKRDKIVEITNLNKPYLEQGEILENPNPKLRLMKYEDFLAYHKENNKLYMWENQWQDISEKGEEKGSKLYKGQRMKKNMKVWEGIGAIKFSDGALYQGLTKDKKFNGPGRMTHPNGDIFQGQWKDGMANGRGIFVQRSTGSTYDGEWVNDTQSGQGIETWSDERFIYTGAFVDGVKTGKGKLVYDENVYEGDFVNGEYHGQGKLFNVKSGKVQEGTFSHNKFVKGQQVFDDGSYYEGEFKDGKMHGAGRIYYANGSVFVGTFAKDKKHGIGNLFDFENQFKQREEYVSGSRKDFMKTPCSTEELQSQLDHPSMNGRSQMRYKKQGIKLQSAVTAAKFSGSVKGARSRF